MMRRLLVLLVRAYQLLFRPWIGSNCRFSPSCSGYAIGAVQHHCPAAGSYLALRRLARCHPWCDGGTDPVPDHAPPLFSRWLASPFKKSL